MAQPNLPVVDPARERAERAERLTAMFNRWATEDISGEPDWSVEVFERLDLTRPFADDDRAAPTRP